MKMLRGVSFSLPFLGAAEDREKFFKRIALLFPPLDSRYQTIERAYNCAKDAFRGKSREGGERYFEHLRAVALILIDYLRIKDYQLIVAALFHDIVEDIPYWPIERVQNEFGDGVALLVAWLTKPSHDQHLNKSDRDAAYHDRFKFAPRDFFLIKLADRLHNLLTLDGCSKEKKERKIAETRIYYLPHAEKHLILIHELEWAIKKLSKQRRVRSSLK